MYANAQFENFSAITLLDSVGFSQRNLYLSPSMNVIGFQKDLTKNANPNPIDTSWIGGNVPRKIKKVLTFCKMYLFAKNIVVYSYAGHFHKNYGALW